MTDVVGTITDPSGISAVQTQASAIPASVTTSVSSSTFVFFAGFDGTDNIGTNPDYSGDAQSTAVYSLVKQVDSATSGLSNVQSNYYAGVGTPGTELGSSVLPTDQSMIRIKRGQARINF